MQTPVRLVEGVNLANITYFPTADPSIQRIIRFFGYQPTYPGMQRGLLLSLIITLACISLFLFKYRLKNISISLLFLIGVVLIIKSVIFF